MTAPAPRVPRPGRRGVRLPPAPTFSEGELQRALLVAFNALPGIRAWRQQTGKVKVRGGWMQLSPNGAGDIVGTAAPDGLHLEVEVKGWKHEVQPDQDPWGAETIAAGAVYLRAIPRRGETIEQTVERVVVELLSAIAEARSRRAKEGASP